MEKKESTKRPLLVITAVLSILSAVFYLTCWELWLFPHWLVIFYLCIPLSAVLLFCYSFLSILQKVSDKWLIFPILVYWFPTLINEVRVVVKMIFDLPFYSPSYFKRTIYEFIIIAVAFLLIIFTICFQTLFLKVASSVILCIYSYPIIHSIICFFPFRENYSWMELVMKCGKFLCLIVQLLLILRLSRKKKLNGSLKTTEFFEPQNICLLYTSRCV